jgi:hypothetical protein
MIRVSVQWHLYIAFEAIVTISCNFLVYIRDIYGPIRQCSSLEIYVRLIFVK